MEKVHAEAQLGANKRVRKETESKRNKQKEKKEARCFLTLWCAKPKQQKTYFNRVPINSKDKICKQFFQLISCFIFYPWNRSGCGVTKTKTCLSPVLSVAAAPQQRQETNKSIPPHLLMLLSIYLSVCLSLLPLPALSSSLCSLTTFIWARSPSNSFRFRVGPL